MAAADRPRAAVATTAAAVDMPVVAEADTGKQRQIESVNLGGRGGRPFFLRTPRAVLRKHPFCDR